MSLIPHFLEAEGTLRPWRVQFQADIADLDGLFTRILSTGPGMPDVDVLIERVAGSGIPGIGFGGHCFRRGALTIHVDPDDFGFRKSLDAGQFGRTLAHEFHHCLRHAGAGYGKTLGEAMVSEGLADYFVLEAMGGEPPVWCTALHSDDWASVLAAATEELLSDHYNHFQWFFGQDAVWPRWAGYTIGFQLVEHYLADHPELLPSRMAGTPAQDIIDYAWPRLLATHAERFAAVC